MEEATNNPATNPAPTFTAGSQQMARPPKKKGSRRWILVVIAVLLVGVGAGLFALGAAKNKKEEPSPTPTPLIEGLKAPSDFEPEEEEEEVEEVVEVEKSEVAIEVLNGTGVSGEAGYLQGKLEVLGYEEIEVDNASEQDYAATEVSFASDLPKDIVEEITEELEGIYDEVEVKTSRSLTGVDVRIITGEREGVSAEPSATAEPTAEPSPTVEDEG